MRENTDPEDFQQCLWNMFEYKFHAPLSPEQVDRIRWHIFPEIRIEQGDLFEKNALPEKDVLKVMDIEQEKLARNLGAGHRVIHGVAGSGKTLILLHRCRYLAQQAKKLPAQKPILVLCFNIVLAKKLQSLIVDYGIAEQVRVHHFHGWCIAQLNEFGIGLINAPGPVYERQVASVIKAVKNGRIPGGQYGAVLVDEGHDFEKEWLELIVRMPDPDTENLLFLYDDAQSIYKNTNQLGFSLSEVGIKARGRTAILRLNYRNTDEIFYPAYRIGEQCFMGDQVEDSLPVIQPKMAGRYGAKPEFKIYSSVSEELGAVCSYLQHWHDQGDQYWSSMCVLYRSGGAGKQLREALQRAGIPVQWLSTSEARKQFRPSLDAVVLMTMHSSKGLEFSNVIVHGINTLNDSSEAALRREIQLLYVAMTRATDKLLLTAWQQNGMARRVQDAFGLDEVLCAEGGVPA
ncbi:MAG: DNA helicase II [Thiotrichales bacterium]|nr:MAG: DNA helicase II [Thiotrichales bacterium]